MSLLDFAGIEAAAPTVRRAAMLSPCETWRYALWRVWDDGRDILVVCMLNPSKADARIDDPTVLALIWFATLWGYGGILIVNLYAYRTSKPEEMMAVDQPTRVGPDSPKWLQHALATATNNGRRLLVAWGNDGDFEGRGDWFAKLATERYGLELICLGTTQSGAPKHPMARGHHRIPRDQQPIAWRKAA